MFLWRATITVWSDPNCSWHPDSYRSPLQEPLWKLSHLCCQLLSDWFNEITSEKRKKRQGWSPLLKTLNVNSLLCWQSRSRTKVTPPQVCILCTIQIPSGSADPWETLNLSRITCSEATTDNIRLKISTWFLFLEKALLIIAEIEHNLGKWLLPAFTRRSALVSSTKPRGSCWLYLDKNKWLTCVYYQYLLIWTQILLPKNSRASIYCTYDAQNNWENVLL